MVAYKIIFTIHWLQAGRPAALAQLPDWLDTGLYNFGCLPDTLLW